MNIKNIKLSEIMKRDNINVEHILGSFWQILRAFMDILNVKSFIFGTKYEKFTEPVKKCIGLNVCT